jgi:diguanylate cyclase (GGDEF)-like protein/PAS domain S-box-containing protein
MRRSLRTLVSRQSRLSKRLWLSRRLWLTLLMGVVVAVAMVTAAERARDGSDRDRQAQVLVERVRAATQQVSSITWRAVARALDPASPRLAMDQQTVSAGFGAWAGATRSLTALAALGFGYQAAPMQRDANALQAAGLGAIDQYRTGDREGALRLEETSFRPAVDRMNADARRASQAVSSAAARESRRAGIAFVGSLVLGLLALVALTWRFERLRRRTAVADEVRAVERRSERRLRALIEHSTDVVTVLGDDLRIRWQAASIERVLGHKPAALVGGPLTAIVHPDDMPRLEGFLGARLERAGSAALSARFRDAAGGWRHVEAVAENRLHDPAVEGVVLSMRDVSERHALEEELRRRAFHDALTGLANRALFEDRLRHALARMRRDQRSVAVLFVDLDDFKTINDSLGHTAGDELLRKAAERISSVVRPVDTAARLGGDEFAILVETMPDDMGAQAVAERVLDTLKSPFELAGRELIVTASVGLALAEPTTDADQLLRNADVAMYAAKDRGKNSIHAFEQSMHQRVLDRLELRGELQRAIDAGQFELDYQPIVELATGAIDAVEALVRWRHPTRGRLAPNHFIGLAEETGAIVPLGTWILHEACTQARRWQRERPLAISVNVSTRQLRDPAFPEVVADVLDTTGLDPQALILEITESLFASDGDEVALELQRLKQIGVRVAVDDFGTGYSALSRLQRFPIDILKIDKSFIDGIDSDAGKAQLVRGIVDLGGSLELDIVAEGIEGREQADRLRAMRSRLGQGFLFSRPVGRAEMESLLAADHAAWSAAATGR